MVYTVEEIASCEDIQYIFKEFDLKAFVRKHSFERVQLKAFNQKRSIESVQLKAFNRKRSIESVQVGSKAFNRKHVINIGCPHNWQFLPLWSHGQVQAVKSKFTAKCLSICPTICQVLGEGGVTPSPNISQSPRSCLKLSFFKVITSLLLPFDPGPIRCLEDVCLFFSASLGS